MIRTTLQSLRDQFLEWVTRARSPKTARLYRHYLGRFLAAVGDMPVSKLRPLHLLGWGRTWHEVQAVQRMMAWAVADAELIERNPFARVKLPRIGQRRRILDRKTMARLLRRAGVEMRLLLITLRETLARPQEARALRWEWIAHASHDASTEAALVDGKAVFLIEEYKSRDRRHDSDAPRIIPISPRLGRLLARLMLRRDHAAGEILLNTRRLPWTKNSLRLAFRRLRRRCGIVADHRGENVVSYTFRHTLATWATAAGVRDRLLADLLGHSSTRTTRRYQHLETEHLQHALMSIQSRRRGPNIPAAPPPL